MASLTARQKRTLAFLGGVIFCVKLLSFTHNAVHLSFHGPGQVELVESSQSASALDGWRGLRGQELSSCCRDTCGGEFQAQRYECLCCPKLAKGDDSTAPSSSAHSSASQASDEEPRIIPRLTKISTCCHEHCGGMQSHDYQCACCTNEKPMHSSHAQASRPHHEGAGRSTSRSDRSSATHSGQGIVPKVATVASGQEDDDHAANSMPMSSKHSTHNGRPMRISEGAAQARPVDGVNMAIAQQQGQSSEDSSTMGNTSPRSGGETAASAQGSWGGRGAGYHAMYGLDPQPRHNSNGRDRSFDNERSGNDEGGAAADEGQEADRRSMRSSNQVYGKSSRSPLDDFVGTNIVFHGTSSEGGIPRSRRRETTGMLADKQLAKEGGGHSEEEELHEFTWNKSWWGFKEWALWLLAAPIPTLLIFVVSFFGQGFLCAMIYLALLVPLDVVSFYYDLYAYAESDASYWLIFSMFCILNFFLCICILPAYAAFSLQNQEQRQPAAGGGGGAQPGDYGATGFQAFQGQGQPTGYGQRTPKTQMV